MVKKSFNIVLNSDDATSYTGNLYNATYYLHLNNILSNEELKKSYNMTFSFVSVESGFIKNSALYLLSISLLGQGKVLQNNSYSNIVGSLCVKTINYKALDDITGAVFGDGYFDTKQTDNPKLFYESLLDNTTLNLQVLFSNGLEVTTLPSYVCILHFTEL